MAERLESFPALPDQSRHDWERFLNGDIWLLKRGEDFAATPKTFVSSARTHARNRKGRLKTRMVDESSVAIQFLPA